MASGDRPEAMGSAATVNLDLNVEVEGELPGVRTAKVRVEVPNPDRRLRLGMYVTMSFTSRDGERAAVVPRTAVQTIGDRHVVFVPVRDEEGKFIQRTVRVGRLVDDSYMLLGGLKPGEAVVTEGSFFLRAESLRTSPSG